MRPKVKRSRTEGYDRISDVEHTVSQVLIRSILLPSRIAFMHSSRFTSSSHSCVDILLWLTLGAYLPANSKHQPFFRHIPNAALIRLDQSRSVLGQFRLDTMLGVSQEAISSCWFGSQSTAVRFAFRETAECTNHHTYRYARSPKQNDERQLHDSGVQARCKDVPVNMNCILSRWLRKTTPSHPAYC